MIPNLTLLLIVMTSFGAFSQEETSKSSVDSIFRLQTDSIGRKTIASKSETDSSYLLYYTVTNISSDTLIFITNSCFYYNHFSLQVGKLEFDLNADGGCSINAVTPHSIAPGESFHKTEWITSPDLHKLSKGEWTVSLSIPLIKHDDKTYRIDGRNFVKNKEILTGVSAAKIFETPINRKRKKSH